jgi:hypothetical protein
VNAIKNEYDEKIDVLKGKFIEVSQLFTQLNSLCEIQSDRSLQNEVQSNISGLELFVNKKEFLNKEVI